jgi:hypothetical protein
MDDNVTLANKTVAVEDKNDSSRGKQWIKM